jgi:hypothetical protein
MLTRRLVFISALSTFSLFSLGAQAASITGSGKVITEARTVAEFAALAGAGSMDMLVRQGPQQSVQVSADDNLIPLLETVVENGKNGATLMVRWKQGHSIYTRSKVLVTVVVPKLSAVSLSGSGDAKVESFTTPSLQVAVSGSSDVMLPGLNTEDLSVRISGSGDVRGDGKATKLSISVAGSGDVRLADMRADDVSVRIAGSGDAAVQAQKTLDVSVAGSGDVTYTGAATVKKSVAGSGSVTKR